MVEKIDRLTQYNQVAGDPDGQVINQVNAIKEVQFLVGVVSKQAAEISELKTTKAALAQKAEKEIEFLLNIVRAGHPKIEKQKKSISYLLELVTKQGNKLAASEALIPKYKKELAFLHEALLGQAQKKEASEQLTERYKKELAYMVDRFTL